MHDIYYFYIKPNIHHLSAYLLSDPKKIVCNLVCRNWKSIKKLKILHSIDCEASLCIFQPLKLNQTQMNEYIIQDEF